VNSSAKRPIVLILHTDYQQRGGEEESLEAEMLCFKELGFHVQLLKHDNSTVHLNARSGLRALFNIRSFKDVWQAGRRYKPVLIYANNLWPALSPSALLAARLLRITTVQTLHNYRLVTPSARLDDSGRCVVCRTRRHPFGCVLHGCYRSVAASLTCAVASFLYRAVVLGWKRHWYLAPSFRAKQLLVRGGVREKRFLIRRNFLPLSSETRTNHPRRNVVTFVGRLSEEKGIAPLVHNWPSCAGFPELEIVGDGPLRHEIRDAARSTSNISFLGPLSSVQVLRLMGTSLLTVVPSCWAEPFGRVALESMSVGTPVMTTGHGALAEIVGDAGIIFDELTPDQILRAVVAATEPGTYDRLSNACLERYWSTYSLATAESEMKNILRSMDLYQTA
jgi:glycosyltransferase involved in cell wall biosynthesis